MIKVKKNVVPIVVLVFSSMLVWTGASAQQTDTLQQPKPQEGIREEVREDFTEKELKSFVKANEKVVQIQQESELRMVAAIEKEGLTVERFNEILESQRNPQQQGTFTPEEMNSFNNAAEVIINEKKESDVAMATSIEEEGIDVNTYQEIMVAYHQSPAIQSKVNKILQGGGKDDN